MADFRMPSLGADMEAGTLRAWLRKPGEPVKKGEIIAEVETEKGIVEVESFASGVVERILVEPGTRVPVGTVLAVIRGEGEPAAPPSAPSPLRVKVTPRARRRAQELGVDLSLVKGTGADGSIVEEDVERAAKPAAVPSVPAPPAEDRAAAMRRAIGAAMARSKREIPHYYLRTTVDCGPMLAWLERTNAPRPATERVLPIALFVKATALALRTVPELNGHYIGDDVRPSGGIHVGIALNLRGGGLVAPAVHDTDQLRVDDLMRAFTELTERARSGVQRASEVTDATITVTSLGERGVETVFPVIHPPQVAIVGVGRIVERPWVVEGKVLPRPVTDLTLAADHRASSGHRGALFLSRLAELLARPEEL